MFGLKNNSHRRSARINPRPTSNQNSQQNGHESNGNNNNIIPQAFSRAGTFTKIVRYSYESPFSTVNSLDLQETQEIASAKKKPRPKVYIDYHGINNYAESSTPVEKLFWATVLVVGISGFAWGLVNLYDEFATSPTATLSKTVLIQSNLTLPEIAFCSLHPLNISKLISAGYSVNQIQQLHWHFLSDVYEQLGFEEAENFTTVVADFVSEPWDEFVREYGTACEPFLKACSIGYKPFDCCSYVHQTIHEKFGVCYVFRKLVQKASGAHAGLVVLLEHEDTTQYIPTDRPFVPVESAFVVEMGRKYIAPKTIIARDQLLIPPDTVANIGLTMNIYTRLTGRKNQTCETDVGYNDFEEYSRPACEVNCFAKSVETYCNCTLLGFKIDPSQDTKDLANGTLDTCYPSQVQQCLTNTTSDESELERLACVEHSCNAPCNEVTFGARTTYATLNSERISVQRSQSSSKKYSKVHLYFPQLQYNDHRELLLLTFHRVISSIGGQLGLYLGASMVTVIQALVTAIKYTIWLYKKKQKENK